MYNITFVKGFMDSWRIKDQLDVTCYFIPILMSETCWAHKNWNKIASDIKLVFYSSTIAIMHGPINIRGFMEFVYDPIFSVIVKIPYYMLQSPDMERKVEY